jgi:hypothetical protein
LQLPNRVEDIVTTAYDQYHSPSFSKRRLGGQASQTKFRPMPVDYAADYYDDNEENVYTDDAVRFKDRIINHRIDDSHDYDGDDEVSRIQERALSLRHSAALQPYQRQWGRYKPSVPRFAYLGKIT